MCESVLEAIGNTPLINLNLGLPQSSADIWIKVESANPGGSIKDRPALNMIHEAEQRGDLAPGGTVVESTSGNLGVALAMICAVKGYRCIVVADPRTSKTNLDAARAFGAQVEIVTTKNLADGTFQEARIKRARELAQSIEGAFMPWQYGNPDNPAAHQRQTAQEILKAFPDGPDALVASVSTAGHLSGLARGLKDAQVATKIVGVDVEGSVVFGGQKSPTAITGMGLGWQPENLELRMVDEAFKVAAEPALGMARVIARKAGMLLGGSSGAAIFVGVAQALRMQPGQAVVVIAPDRGEKYLSEFYDDQWCKARGLFLENRIEKLVDKAWKISPIRYPSVEKGFVSSDERD